MPPRTDRPRIETPGLRAGVRSRAAYRIRPARRRSGPHTGVVSRPAPARTFPPGEHRVRSRPPPVPSPVPRPDRSLRLLPLLRSRTPRPRLHGARADHPGRMHLPRHRRLPPALLSRIRRRRHDRRVHRRRGQAGATRRRSSTTSAVCARPRRNGRTRRSPAPISDRPCTTSPTGAFPGQGRRQFAFPHPWPVSGAGGTSAAFGHSVCSAPPGRRRHHPSPPKRDLFTKPRKPPAPNSRRGARHRNPQGHPAHDIP